MYIYICIYIYVYLDIDRYRFRYTDIQIYWVQRDILGTPEYISIYHIRVYHENLIYLA